MKRTAPASPSNRSDIDELEEDTKPTITGSPFTPPPAKKTKKVRPPKTSPSTGSDTSPKRSPANKITAESGSDWTAEKREAIIDRVISAGYKALDLGALAQEFDLTRRQLINQFAPSRKGTLREKAIKAVGGSKAE